MIFVHCCEKNSVPSSSENLSVPLARKGHDAAAHGQQQGLCGMGADDLAAKPGIDEVRHLTDMIDMGVGQKQIVNFIRCHGKLGEGQLWVVTLGVPQSTRILSAVGETWAGLQWTNIVHRQGGANDSEYF